MRSSRVAVLVCTPGIFIPLAKGTRLSFRAMYAAFPRARQGLPGAGKRAAPAGSWARQHRKGKLIEYENEFQFY